MDCANSWGIRRELDTRKTCARGPHRPDLGKGAPKAKKQGAPKANLIRQTALGRHDVGPTALCEWNGWWRTDTTEFFDGEISVLVGGSKAPQTIMTYVSCFKHWSHFRELQGKHILIQDGEDPAEAENDILRFAALQVGHLGETAATVTLHLTAISPARKVRIGYNPIAKMPRAKLLLHGAQR